MNSPDHNFNKSIIDLGKLYFKKFTHRFLNKQLGKRWDYLIEHELDKWGKVDIWELWEVDSCKMPINEWFEDIDSFITYINSKNVKDPLALGLGHSKPYIKKILPLEIKDELKVMLEGLIIFKDADLVIARNHDGDLLIFE